MFKNEEYSSFLNIFIRLVLKHDKFTSFISLFRPLGYPMKPRPFKNMFKIHRKIGPLVVHKPIYVLIVSSPI